MIYDYRKAVEDDVYDYIKENLDELKEKHTDLSEAGGDLYKTLVIQGSVTGNASRSYTFNSAQATEYLKDNADIGIEAYTEFGKEKSKFYEDFVENPKKADVTIRCYCLPRAILNICNNYDFDDF